MESNQNTFSSSTATDINDRRHESDEVDYISYMPIEVLLHIFSFLPLKFWVLMSLVSKRQKYFWTQIPDIELNESEMVQSILKKNSWCSFCDQIHSYNPFDHGCHLHLRKAATKKFMSIVDRILLLHSGCPITRFHLSIDYNSLKGYTSRIDAWIDFSMTSNIERLELNFSGGRIVSDAKWNFGLNLNALYRFKDTSFAPKMLKTLTLISCIFEVHVFAALNSLQILSLFDVDIHGCRIGDMISICPLLEVLKFKRCFFPKDFMICKEELKIKDLILIDCTSYPLTAFPIDLIAPRLATLTIDGHHLRSSSIKKATNMVNAEVIVKCRFPHPTLGDFMAALLIDLSQCQNLELNSWCLEVLSTRDSLPLQLRLEFQNLRNLRLRIYMIKYELPGLAYLISCSPNLETLNLDIILPLCLDIARYGFIPNVFGNEEESFWESQYAFRFHCLQNSLKKVNINGFAGRSIEMHMVKFLLQNAMGLEELNITQSRPTASMSNEQKLVYMRIMLHNCVLITTCRKASPDVRIKVLY